MQLTTHTKKLKRLLTVLATPVAVIMKHSGSNERNPMTVSNAC